MEDISRNSVLSLTSLPTLSYSIPGLYFQQLKMTKKAVHIEQQAAIPSHTMQISPWIALEPHIAPAKASHKGNSLPALIISFRLYSKRLNS
jgi:hypothetical protein